MNKLVVVILAAGKGTRMQSDIPKVCQIVGSKTMIEHVVKTSLELNPVETVIVVSKNNIGNISKILEPYKDQLRFKIQYQQLGTADAVMSALSCCDNDSNILVLLGDVPLITSQTLSKIISTPHDAVIVGFKNYDFENRFGRIVIEHNRVSRIVEYSDATSQERENPFCNSGLLWIKAEHIPLLYQIQNNNIKREYYLTDIIEIMARRNLEIGFLEATITECMGVNTPEDLELANSILSVS